MTWRDTFWTAMDAVRSHRLRSALTMLGILIGITAVVLTVGIGQGASATVRDQINELGTNVLVVSPGRVVTPGRRRSAGPRSCARSPARPAVLLLPAAASVLLGLVAARCGQGPRQRPAPGAQRRVRMLLLLSWAAQALRGQRDSLIAWAVSFAVFAFILGVVSSSVSSSGIPACVSRQIAKLGVGSIATPAGYLALIFLLYVLGVSLFACAQVGAARREEAGQQLETLLALPVGRTGWLTGRLLLGAAAAALICVLTGLLTWAGAAAGGPASAPGRCWRPA